MRSHAIPLDEVTVTTLLKVCAKEAAAVRAGSKGHPPGAPLLPRARSPLGAALLESLGADLSTLQLEDWAGTSLALLKDAIQSGVKPQVRVLPSLRFALSIPLSTF
jgi:hypothetical protein